MNQENLTSGKRNIIWIILGTINLVLIFVLIAKPEIIFSNPQNAETVSFDSETFVPTSTDELVDYVKPTSTSIKITTDPSSIDEFVILSMNVDQKSKLYLFDPQKNSFTQLFNDPYERIHPALSENQEMIAYSAKINGYWDLYFLDLVSGIETRVTDTHEYEGAPTWSPDNQYLAYESYKHGNLDIFIQDVSDLNKPPIQLTSDEFAQFSPAWSPKGDEIAFVSTENDEEEIYIAKLSTLENRFVQITDRPNLPDLNPKWSPDGQKIFWMSESNGYPVLVSSTPTNNYSLISEVGSGTDISISKISQSIIQEEANQSFLIIKNTEENHLLFPPYELPGSVQGHVLLSDFHGMDKLLERVLDYPSPIANPPQDEQPEDRKQLAVVENLEANSHYLHEDAIEPFYQFRTMISNETGWDFFYQLDNTYVPITDPTVPGMVEDWLFTGRAFEFNPLSTYAGLVVSIKEERSGNTYWRILVKSRYQDGSQGLPVRQLPFDISSRYNNDPATYETGGKKIPIPEGYWVDITEIGRGLKWERLPALGNWQRYFEATRFNQFVLADNLDWYTAMKQIYPLEALKTPSPLPTNPLTPTFSPTVRYYRSPTITPTIIETIQPTFRPTWTPIP